METERLLLRPWSPEDLEALGAVFARPEVWRYPLGRGFTREETRAFLERQLGYRAAGEPFVRAAVLRETGKLIGYVGLSVPHWLPEALPAVEIGWRLDPDHWGRGLATEGARAALSQGFEQLGLDEIIAIYQPENVASGRVMERLGMRFARDTVDPVRGVALRVYSLSREEWAQR